MTPGPDASSRAPLRALILKSNDMYLGGAARAIEMYVAHLDRTVVEPVLGHVVTEDGPATHVETSPRCADMEHHRIPWRGLRRARQSAAELRRVVAKAGIDVVLSNDMRTDFTCRLAGARRGLGVPWAAFVHGWIGFRRKGKDHLYGIFEIIDRWSVRRADEVWVPSRDAESNVRRFLPRRVPMRVISEAVDPHYLQPTPEDVARVRAAMDVPEGSVLVGMLGRMAWAKGHHLLAEAVVESGCDELVAVLLGFGEEEENLRRMASAPPYQGRVILPGAEASVRDMPAYLAALDLFCFASLQESFGLAVLEAMVLGCAVAGSRTGEVPHMLDEGEAGMLFPPGDVKAMASCLRTLVRDPELRARLAERGRERALAEFAPARYARDMERAFAGIVERTAGR